MINTDEITRDLNMLVAFNGVDMINTDGITRDPTTLVGFDGVISQGSVTLANLRISALAGMAFVDFNLANILTLYPNKKLIITSAGKNLTGWIKAVGTGETYDTEILTNPSFDTNTSGWSVLNSAIASVLGGQSGKCLQATANSSDWQGAYQANTLVSGALYLLSAYVKDGTITGKTYRAGFYKPGVDWQRFATGNFSATWVQNSVYMVGTQTSYQFVVAKMSTDTGGTILFDEVSAKHVLTPSTTGVTIVSTKGGSTYDWTSVDSGFNYSAATYTYKISNA